MFVSCRLAHSIKTNEYCESTKIWTNSINGKPLVLLYFMVFLQVVVIALKQVVRSMYWCVI